jgi:hypothetical protein
MSQQFADPCWPLTPEVFLGVRGNEPLRISPERWLGSGVRVGKEERHRPGAEDMGHASSKLWFR